MMSKMEFDCKLAHGGEVKRISGFNSIKELYERVGQTFSVPINEILFCTINTHNFRDMNSLLGNFLSLGDLIVVHMCGSSKELSIKKTQEYLGLTITDNGHGRAFVKKVKSGDGLIEQLIRPGDHIVAINSESTVGMRHYEVAKILREMPAQTNFTLKLIEPLHSDTNCPPNKDDEMYLDDRLAASDLKPNDIRRVSAHSLFDFGARNHPNGRTVKTLESGETIATTTIATSTNDPEKRENSNSPYDEDLINSSLPIDRLLSKETREQETGADSATNNVHNYRTTIEKINSILESSLGINDNTLAIQIYRLAKENKDSFQRFKRAIEMSELSVFNFDEDIETFLWKCAIGVVG